MNFKDALDKLMAGDQIAREGFQIVIPGKENYSFSKDDMCANNWEVIPKKVTITKLDLEAAWSRMELSGKSHVLIDLAKEIGL